MILALTTKVFLAKSFVLNNYSRRNALSLSIPLSLALSNFCILGIWQLRCVCVCAILLVYILAAVCACQIHALVLLCAFHFRNYWGPFGLPLRLYSIRCFFELRPCLLSRQRWYALLSYRQYGLSALSPLRLTVQLSLYDTSVVHVSCTLLGHTMLFANQYL